MSDQATKAVKRIVDYMNGHDLLEEAWDHLDTVGRRETKEQWRDFIDHEFFHDLERVKQLASKNAELRNRTTRCCFCNEQFYDLQGLKDHSGRCVHHPIYQANFALHGESERDALRLCELQRQIEQLREKLGEYESQHEIVACDGAIKNLLDENRALKASLESRLPLTDHEEARVLVLSTCHITKEDGQRLASIGTDGMVRPLPTDPCRGAFEEGGWFWTGNTEREHAEDDYFTRAKWINDWSDTLRLALLWARSQGYDYVLFDRDAGQVDALPVFHW